MEGIESSTNGAWLRLAWVEDHATTSVVQFRPPTRLVSTTSDPASQLLRELIGMEDIIQGMSRCKLIETGSAIAPVTVLSGVGVAQQAAPCSRCLRALARKISHEFGGKI
jgi:hypothetical protein